MKAKVKSTGEQVNVVIGSIDFNSSGKQIYIYFEDDPSFTSKRKWEETELEIL